jgi:hypothetical protein
MDLELSSVSCTYESYLKFIICYMTLNCALNMLLDSVISAKSMYPQVNSCVKMKFYVVSIDCRCPVAGCKNDIPLRPEDLIDDKQLKKYIEKKHRKAIKM